MEHKVKIVEVLERHKIHPKAKVQMNIPFCRMISMSIVWPTLKMEQAFHMGYQEGNKVFYVSPTN
jgi:hypothetical protein